MYYLKLIFRVDKLLLKCMVKLFFVKDKTLGTIGIRCTQVYFKFKIEKHFP